MKLTYEQQRVLAGMDVVDGPLLIKNRKGKILKLSPSPPLIQSHTLREPPVIPKVVAHPHQPKGRKRIPPCIVRVN